MRSEKCNACIRLELEGIAGLKKPVNALSTRAWNLSRGVSYHDSSRTQQSEPQISLYNDMLSQITERGKSYSFSGETFNPDKSASIDATDLVTVTPQGKRSLHGPRNVRMG